MIPVAPALSRRPPEHLARAPNNLAIKLDRFKRSSSEPAFMDYSVLHEAEFIPLSRVESGGV
jgi:hypothetical protein